MRRPNMFITIRCMCGRQLQLMKVGFARRDSKGIKSHAHCKPCRLEWHLDWTGRIYNHPYQLGLKKHNHTASRPLSTSDKVLVELARSRFDKLYTKNPQGSQYA